ncbi:RsmB/NOP family class I SAM-dependent RNA methyltransferase [Pseudoalteromonas sp. MTN2-4]|uniref:RsmB/NOP family class I SAM-dependent RNA methyltransferase n=1 Tax=Pseudoalteromonas sp. MTN2-4 TaxID=3056555 RepID=UPI0036F1D204
MFYVDSARRLSENQLQSASLLNLGVRRVLNDSQCVEAIISCIKQVFETEQYADKAIEAGLANQAFWNQATKAYYVQHCYELIRYHRQLNTALDIDTSDENWPWLHFEAYQLLNGVESPNWSEFAGLDVEILKANLDEASPAEQQSYPDWLWQRAEQELGDDWVNIAQALNVPAKPYLRVNTLKTDAETLQTSLKKSQSITKVHEQDNCLEVEEYGYLFKSDAFSKGWFEMQDAGSQQIAPLLDVKPGQRVVDACAGAGGKSLHLANLMQNKGYILSMDIHQHKLDALKKRAKRAGVHMLETRLIKNSKTIKRLKEKFDRVLLDVPCSGTGVLRRNPDAKWHLQPENIDTLINLQAEILQRYSQMCKVGGKLVYATCSIFPSENQQQVQAFLENNPNFELLEELNLQPGINSEYDGFYAAVLTKKEI